MEVQIMKKLRFYSLIIFISLSLPFSFVGCGGGGGGGGNDGDSATETAVFDTATFGDDYVFAK